MPRIIIDEAICKGCEMCVYACPRKIISLARDRMNGKGHHPAVLTDEAKCTGCRSCAIMCPDTAITVER